MARPLKLVLIITAALAPNVLASNTQTPNGIEGNIPGRNSKKYDGYYYISESGDSAESFKDNQEESEDSDKKSSQPISEENQNEPISFAEKDYSPYPIHKKGYPPVGYNYKGFPYNGPFNVNGVTHEKMTEMLMMMNAMDKLQGIQKKNGESFLSKILSKPVAVAAIVPLVILLFSVLPALMNYFLSGITMPLNMTTIASSRMVRSFTDKDFLESTLQNLMEFGTRALSEDECFQKSICEAAISHGGEKNMKNVASLVAKYGGRELLNSLHANNLIKSLKHGDCSRVCHHKSRSQKDLQ